MAAPGRIACAIASPTRLMRRSIRNTPIGAGAERKRQRADQRAAHELEIGEGGNERVVDHDASGRARRQRRLARRARRRPRTCAAPSDRFSGGQHIRGLRPRPPARARAAASREISPRTRSRSCSAASTVRFSSCQRRTRSSRSADGLGVDRVERLVEHDHARVLQQQPREQHALHLPARKRADRPLLEAGEADGRQRLHDLRCAERRPDPLNALWSARTAPVQRSTLFRGIVGILKPLAGSRSLRRPRCPRHRLSAAERGDRPHVSDLGVRPRRQGACGAPPACSAASARTSATKIVKAIAAVGLTGFENRAIGTLSGGQMQRMLFARLLLQDARVIVLDEPFNAIDAKTSADLLALVRRWHEREAHGARRAARHRSGARQFPETLLLAREPVAWGQTAQVLTRKPLEGAADVRGLRRWGCGLRGARALPPHAA